MNDKQQYSCDKDSMNIHKTYARNLCELIKSHPLVGSRGMPFGLVGFIGVCSPGLLNRF